MEIPFSANKVKDAANKLKSNRSPGSDNISIELIKNSPDTIHQNIAETYIMLLLVNSPKKSTRVYLHRFKTLVSQKVL